MCFSASASFTTAAALTLIGIYGLKKTTITNRYLFAGIPILFGIQQACEGIVWVLLARGYQSILASISMYAFLFFALVFWPLWLPVSLYVAEYDQARKRLMLLPLSFGLIVACYILVHLLFVPIETTISCSHIMYDIHMNVGISVILTMAYGCATVLPLFLSSLPYTAALGVILFGSYWVSYFFYTNFITSVWCFFAALLSVLIAFIVSRPR